MPTDIVYSHFASTGNQWTTVPSEPAPGLRVARTLIPPTLRPPLYECVTCPSRRYVCVKGNHSGRYRASNLSTPPRNRT